MTRFGADTATCEVFTFRAGLLAAAGHDLKLRPERFEIEADGHSVRARFDAASLRVVAAMRGGREDAASLSARDRQEIERTCAREVLEAQRFPEIIFTSNEIPAGAVRSPEIVFTSNEIPPDAVRGTLLLHGRELSVELALRREGPRAVAAVEIDVRRFGIRPYAAMLGALRVSPRVRVVATTPWPDV
jgi:YceI-like protein